MSSFNHVSGVPAGSRVKVDVSPCDGTFVTKAKLISTTDVVTWNPCNDTAAKGPLEAGRAYFVSVRFAFIATSTVDVEIRIEAPGGGGPAPWTWKVNGDQGEVALVGGLIQVA